MAKAIMTQYGDFVKKTAETFTEQKLGEYSKYLEEKPFFVTYYSLSNISTRVENGLHAVYEEIGEQSPCRYNRICNFPLFNFRDLKPETDYDEETGVDVDIENTDLIFLPNTVKPKEGDYFVAELAGTGTVLFRIINTSYNTIQSNDYYLGDYEYKGKNEQIENKLKTLDKLVVDTYTCIYENIGTEDRCIVKSDDFKKAQELAKSIDSLRKYYRSIYFFRDIDCFAYKGIYTEYDKSILNDKNFRHQNQGIEEHSLEECNDIDCPIHHPINEARRLQELANQQLSQNNLPILLENVECYFYDIYLIKFIQNSKIFEDAHSDEVYSAEPDDIIPYNFESNYMRSIWRALETKDLDFFDPYLINMPARNRKEFSTINLYHYYNRSTWLEPVEKQLYYSKDLTAVGFKQYLEEPFIKAIVDKDENSYNQLSYTQKVICDFLNDSLPNSIDIKQIQKELLTPSEDGLLYGAMIIFVLIKVYDGYFDKSEDNK